MKPRIKIKQEDLSNKIFNNKNTIWCPSNDEKYYPLNNNTWFNINETQRYYTGCNNLNYKLTKNENVIFRAKKVKLDLNSNQRKIIDKWLYLYSEMYNITLKYIKNNIKNDNKCYNFFNTRKALLNEKKELIKKSNIKVHDIDYAIKLACSNYKTAFSNLKVGNIKNFRIRYWSPNKIIKVMDLEKNNFNNNTIRKTNLGIVKGYYNGKEFNFNSIKSDCRLQKNNNEYYLFVPESTKTTIKTENQNKVIAIDLGVRTFATCISENKAITIGENCSKKIKQYIKRKDLILNNDKISKEIKKKNEKIINRKMNNLVEELHWKSINYLIKNYETIIIGDLNVKGIVKKSGNLSKETKRVALGLKFYNYKQKLIYKCNVNNTKLSITNEWLTSKMCSLCGSISETLGSKKIYNCNNCKSIMDRDINGARNIYIKSII